MSYVHVAGKATRSFCRFLFAVAVFALWASLAAGAGFILLHLPDVWAMRTEDESSRYAIMSVTAFALIVGVLFLVFAAGAIESLHDALFAAHIALRRFRAARGIRRARIDNGAPVTLQTARPTP